VCISQGVPAVPFFVDTDLTRSDGIITCRRVTAVEIVQIGWRLARVLKYLSEIPIVP
jgi:hypothetical protein